VPVRLTPAPYRLSYEANPLHRNPSRRRHHTQWSRNINEQDEFSIFSHSVAAGWGALDSSFWGIRVNDGGHLETLNEASLHDGRKAKWCRFEAETDPRIWHGYPTWPDPKREAPPQGVLLTWSKYPPLTVAKAMKVLRGRRCEF
jgi:hypothetical protein